jgi:hypothetical protein
MSVGPYMDSEAFIELERRRYRSPYSPMIYRVITHEKIVYRDRRHLPVGMAWAIFGLFTFISIASFVMMVITR